jgi:hypothetical protein
LFFQIVANAIWEADYVKSGSQMPGMGLWTAFLYVALICGIGAAWVGVKDILRPRDAFLDYSIVFAAATAVGVAVIGRHLDAGLSLRSADDATRALLSLLIAVVIASAAVGRWQSLPLPVGIVGLSLLFDVAGDLWNSYILSQGAETSNRWPTVMWFTAAIIALLAALALIAGLTRPIRRVRDALPGTSPAPLLVTALLALLAAGLVALHGALGADRQALIAGLTALAWIAFAGLLRTAAALAETRRAYRDLDAAHFEAENEREQATDAIAERDRVIAGLERQNVELRATQAMYESLVELVNDRTDGQLRENLEDAGGELADWLLPHHAAGNEPGE